MEIEKYISLKEKQRQGNWSKDEQQAMQTWMQSAEGKALEKIGQLADVYKNAYEPDAEAGLKRLKAQIQAAKAQEAPGRTLVVASRRRWMSVAAAVMLLAVAVVAMRGLFLPKPATFVVITQPEENRVLTLTDGTRVQLNVNSKLSTPKSFEKAPKRVVELSGEAYFAVKSDASQPFEIKTSDVTITVVGTAFNVRAYPQEETTEVEVVEGVVEMAVGSKKLTLRANQKGIYNSQKNKLYHRSAKQLHAQAWRTNQLDFKNTPLVEILQELGRYHRVKIELANEALKTCAFTGNFGKTKLDDALKSMQLSMQLKWEKIAIDHYIIRSGVCK